MLGRRKLQVLLYIKEAGYVHYMYMSFVSIYDSAYLASDVIRRVMTHMFGIDIVLVMGVTDIDDKIIKRANEVN